MIKEDYTLDELVSTIIEANEAYRLGSPIMSDPEWDALVEKLAKQYPTHELLQEVGYIAADDNRKEKLAHQMRSMNKCKTVDELIKWIKKYNINSDLILTPKFDGCSLLVHEKNLTAHTRGDGEYGQRSNEHFRAFNDNAFHEDMYTYGEVIMPRERFDNKYAQDEENPRNTVAGIMNKDTVTEKTPDCDYVRYGIIKDDMSEFSTKEDIIIKLNNVQKNVVQHQIVHTDDILNKKESIEEFLKEIFERWNTKYEIDGIIIEVNDLELQNSLGREKSGNPAYARAYKGDFEEVKETVVTGVTWQISKKGLLKPVIQIEPTRLDGATVTNVTGNNAKFMKEHNIGTGTEMTVKRSGMVIPKVVDIIDATGFEMPEIECEWNKSGVELVTIEITDEQKVQFIASFFKILEVDNVSEGTCQMLFDAGFDTVKKILEATQKEFETIDRFGSRKAEIVFTEIQSKMKDVTLSKLQHASGCFENLGSKKLVLLEHISDRFLNEELVNLDEITSVEGFSDTSAVAFLSGMDYYGKFIEDIGDLVTVKKTEIKVASSDDMADNVFVFSGVRRKDLEEIIEDKGGKIASGVSAKITHLVMKATGSGSSKETKALGLGKEVITVEQLEEMLK